MHRTRRTFLLLAVLTGCDSPAKVVPVASVSVTPTTATVIVATPQSFTAEARDAQGVALAERVITWRSSNTAVASVSSAGLVTTLTPGDADIQATSEGVTGNATLTVRPVPVASVTVTLPSATVMRGAVVQASAVLRDATGSLLTGRAVTWTSNNPGVAAVDASGLITTVSRGTTVITATTEGQSGSFSLTVQNSPAVVTSISPATLSPFGTAIIRGSGFDTSPGSLNVAVRGVPATIAAATSTQVEVIVPCVGSGLADVSVTNAGAAPAVLAHPLAVNQIAVPLGQALIFTSSVASACNEMAAVSGTARYLVTVFSAATSQNTTSSFEFAGNTPAIGTTVRVVSPSALRAVDPGPPSATEAAASRLDRQHFAMLERDRVEYERQMARSRTLPPSARGALRQSSRVDVAVGDMRNLYFTFTGGCNDTTRVMRSKAIRIGTRSIIWEDSANVVQSSDNPEYADFFERIGRIYDEEQHESIRRTFGDPLLRDSLTDNDGKVHMIFSQRVNGNAAAYVTSCDQFPTTTSRGSNFGQFFYGAVPTTSAPNLESTDSPDGWFYFMARTVVHEVKHIASLSARVANNVPTFEQSWLEEGTARHAEEVWVRESLHHVAWKANTTFGTAATNGLYCDFHASNATCRDNDPLRRPSYGMRRQFDEIRPKLLTPWNWSPYGDGTNQSGSVFYNTTWSLVRYVIDRFGTSDSAFFRALTGASTNGLTNLTNVAGASADHIIGGWGLALFADDYPGLAAPSPDLQFPTWNLRDIYASLNAAPMWSSRWNTPFPISPVPLTFGAFVASINGIRGGAHAYFELSGAFDTTQLLNLRGNASSGPASNLRLAITRLR